MATQKSTELASRALAIYEEKLTCRLEPSNPDDFVAVEPDFLRHAMGVRA